MSAERTDRQWSNCLMIKPRLWNLTDLCVCNSIFYNIYRRNILQYMTDWLFFLQFFSLQNALFINTFFFDNGELLLNLNVFSLFFPSMQLSSNGLHTLQLNWRINMRPLQRKLHLQAWSRRGALRQVHGGILGLSWVRLPPMWLCRRLRPVYRRLHVWVGRLISPFYCHTTQIAQICKSKCLFFKHFIQKFPHFEITVLITGLVLKFCARKIHIFDQVEVQHNGANTC